MPLRLCTTRCVTPRTKCRMHLALHAPLRACHAALRLASGGGPAQARQICARPPPTFAGIRGLVYGLHYVYCGVCMTNECHPPPPGGGEKRNETNRQESSRRSWLTRASTRQTATCTPSWSCSRPRCRSYQPRSSGSERTRCVTRFFTSLYSSRVPPLSTGVRNCFLDEGGR